MNYLKLKEELVVIEVQESNIAPINLEADKKKKRRTSPQVSNKMYAKWLTDKYNRDTCELKAKIVDLELQLKKEKEDNKILRASVSQKRLKYMNEANEFSPELMKDATIQRYKREVDNQNKAIKRLRKSIDTLIAENVKLKNNKQ